MAELAESTVGPNHEVGIKPPTAPAPPAFPTDLEDPTPVAPKRDFATALNLEKVRVRLSGIRSSIAYVEQLNRRESLADVDFPALLAELSSAEDLMFRARYLTQ